MSFDDPRKVWTVKVYNIPLRKFIRYEQMKAQTYLEALVVWSDVLDMYKEHSMPIEDLCKWLRYHTEVIFNIPFPTDNTEV